MISWRKQISVVRVRAWQVFFIGQALFLLLNLYMLLSTFHEDVYKPWLLVQEWIPTECTVLSSRVEMEVHPTLNAKRYRPIIHYAYNVDGSEFSSNVYSAQKGITIRPERCNALVEHYAQGVTATCYVNPKYPDEAVLSRSLYNDYFLLNPQAYFALVMVIPNIWITIWTLMMLREMNEDYDALLKPACNYPVYRHRVFYTFMRVLLYSAMPFLLLGFYLYRNTYSLVLHVPVILLMAIFLSLYGFYWYFGINRMPKAEVFIFPRALHRGGSGKVRWFFLGNTDHLKYVVINLCYMLPIGTRKIHEIPLLDAVSSEWMHSGYVEFTIPEEAEHDGGLWQIEFLVKAGIVRNEYRAVLAVHDDPQPQMTEEEKSWYPWIDEVF